MLVKELVGGKTLCSIADITKCRTASVKRIDTDRIFARMCMPDLRFAFVVSTCKSNENRLSSLLEVTISCGWNDVSVCWPGGNVYSTYAHYKEPCCRQIEIGVRAMHLNISIHSLYRKKT